MEQEGSEKQYSFCVPPLGKSCRVAVYEACIDALAHMTLEGNADKYRLSLGGVTAPKEGTAERQKDENTRCIGTFFETASGGDGDRDLHRS